MNENLRIYTAVRTPPEDALRAIESGRLKGKTDINPMWRIYALTERFGPCGIGWKPVITNHWTETGSDGTIAAFVTLELFVKENGEWSDGIPGIGGSMFVAKESKGLYTSDECYKMAYTDALSVACKLLGFAADVYWAKGGESKYTQQPAAVTSALPPVCHRCGQPVKGVKQGGMTYPAEAVYQTTGGYCSRCYNELNKAKEGGSAADGDRGEGGAMATG